MKTNALMLLCTAAILALCSSHAFGQTVGKRIPGPVEGHFAKPAVLNPDSALPAGTYTVGQAGYFPTLDSAFHKLNNDGVLGNVTLTLIDTLYQAQEGHRFELGAIAGAGPAARVTIRPAVGTNVTIRGDSDAVVSLHNTKYVTLDGRSNPPSPAAGIFVHALYNPASNWNDCVDAWGDADYNEFLHLSLRSDDPRSSPGQVADCIGLGYEGSNTPDNNLVEGNITSGTIGIYVIGLAGSGPQYNVIRNNTVGLASDLLGTWGISSEYAIGTVIEGNTIQYLRRAAFPDYTLGINAYCNLNTIIRNNVVHDLSGSSGARLVAIAGSGYVAQIGQGLQIYNNMVYNLQNTSTTGNGYIGGIGLWRNNNVLVAYNSVKLEGTGANPIGTDALGFDVGMTNVTIRNNILVNRYHQTAGGGCTALWLDQYASFTTDYNDLHVDTTFANSLAVCHWNVGNYRTLGSWQGTGRDLHSVSVSPAFRIPHLHIAADPALVEHAIPVAGIAADFDGEARDISTPDIGADEFSMRALDNFETYSAGQRLACQNPVEWTTWSLTPCSTVEDPLVSSAFAFSGTKSVVIVQNNDLVRRYDSLTTGIWLITFKMYIPSGKAGYFNTLAGFTPHTYNWGMEVYFDSTGAGRLLAGSSSAFPFSYVHNAWQTVKVSVNLNIDSARFYMNNSLIRTWRWTAGASGGGSPRRLDGSDFYGATAWDQMYVDDFEFHADVWTGVDDHRANLPVGYELMQNYPNPFNPSTTIRYGVPRSSHVTLTIYNTLGQQVARLVNEQQQPGYHEAVFRGDGFASGVYFYRLDARPTTSGGRGQAGGFTSVKKLLLLK